MNKKIKIFLIILGLYLLISFSFSLYILSNYVNHEYSEDRYNYDRAKICYDCANGMEEEICPKINKNPSLAGYVEGADYSYPNAKEYGGNFEYIMFIEKTEYSPSSKDIDKNFILKHHYCFFRDWTLEAEHLNLFSEIPKSKGKHYIEALTTPEFYLPVLFPPIRWFYYPG